MTGFDDDEHVLEAIQAGAEGYLLKTQPVDVVIDQLRLLAEGVPQLSPSVARRLLQHFSGAHGSRCRAGRSAAPASRISSCHSPRASRKS